jgi:enterochelin esterase family protein
MRPRPVSLYLFLLFFSLARFVTAQQIKSAPHPAPLVPVVSPEVHPDGSVTFRFRAPNAEEVKLAREGAEPQAMQKDDQGLWSVTTTPLAPDYYGYSFVADGVRLVDPSNPLLKPNLLTTESQAHVPGPPPLPWELNDVPHR